MPLSFFFFKQKTAYEMRISDWSSDVCSSDLNARTVQPPRQIACHRWRLAGAAVVRLIAIQSDDTLVEAQSRQDHVYRRRTHTPLQRLSSNAGEKGPEPVICAGIADRQDRMDRIVRRCCGRWCGVGCRWSRMWQGTSVLRPKPAVGNA